QAGIFGIQRIVPCAQRELPVRHELDRVLGVEGEGVTLVGDRGRGGEGARPVEATRARVEVLQAAAAGVFLQVLDAGEQLVLHAEQAGARGEVRLQGQVLGVRLAYLRAAGAAVEARG